MSDLYFDRIYPFESPNSSPESVLILVRYGGTVPTVCTSIPIDGHNTCVYTVQYPIGGTHIHIRTVHSCSN